MLQGERYSMFYLPDVISWSHSLPIKYFITVNILDLNNNDVDNQDLHLELNVEGQESEIRVFWMQPDDMNLLKVTN